MAKYILIYKSNIASDWSKLPEPEVKEFIQAWKDWIISIGSARKDGGAFVFGGKSATKNGSQDADNKLTGYAVIDLDGDIEEAVTIAQKAPNVQRGIGTIEVYKLLEIKI